MNRIKILAAFLFGAAFGVVVTIKVFAINPIDLLSLPYKNEGVVLKEAVTVKQDDLSIILPAGMELTLVYRMPEGVGFFAVPLMFEGSEEPDTTNLGRQAKYFESRTEENVRAK